MVGLHGNRYEVDPALVGATVELVFDPFDLTTIEVRYQNRPMGAARPVKVGRHAHPQAKPEATPASAPARPTGIDYLAMVEARLAAQTRRAIAYAELPLPDPEPDLDAARDLPSLGATQPPSDPDR